MKKVIILVCVSMLSFGMEAQIITTIAGSGTWFGPGGAFSGDGGPATNAEFFQPCSVTLDSIGNIYIADEYNFRIRKIDTSGVINTIAGSGVYGYGGDDSIATVAKFCDFGYIKICKDGYLYIPDICNNRVRQLNLETNVITTFAGDGSSFCRVDTGSPNHIQLNYPFSICDDFSGDFYITSSCDYVYKIMSSGYTFLYAGSDTTDGYYGSNIPATNARFNHPVDIVSSSSGEIYVSDLGNAILRKIDNSSIITTYAGMPDSFGYYGNGVPATIALLDGNEGIAIDGADNIYFSDISNEVVRRVDHLTGIITTVAGNGTYGYSGDGYLATDAQLGQPAGIAFDRDGNLYIADWYNNRIRKVTNVGVPLKSKEVQKSTAQVSLYPNPAKDQVFIRGVEKGEVCVFDLLGRKRKTLEIKSVNQAMDVGDFEPGVYIVQVHDFSSGTIVSIHLLKE